MKIALVDDELIFLDLLEGVLRAALEKSGIYCKSIDRFSSAEEFMDSWEPFSYNLIFLDIYMGEKNGIDVARFIRETDDKVTLVFCTTSNEFAAHSYEVNASYYMQKPLSEENVTPMLQRIDLARLNESQTIVLPDGFSCVLYKIKYTEYSNHSITLHIEGSKPHSLYMSQADMEELLLSYTDFVVVNRGTIVNIRMVSNIDKESIYINDGTNIPISRSRYKNVAKEYADYKLSKI